MKISGKIPGHRWQVILLCLIPVSWLLFGSIHLHREAGEERPHVHTLLSEHHEDLHPDNTAADIDLTPAGVASPATGWSPDAPLLLIAFILFVPGVCAARRIGFRRRTRQPPHRPPAFRIPPLRAPPLSA